LYTNAIWWNFSDVSEERATWDEGNAVMNLPIPIMLGTYRVTEWIMKVTARPLPGLPLRCATIAVELPAYFQFSLLPHDVSKVGFTAFVHVKCVFLYISGLLPGVYGDILGSM
jgi:hypothetical protein